MVYVSEIEQLREKAELHRARGNERMAAMYDRHAAELERLAEIHAREEVLKVRVKGKTYRVSMNVNDAGQWYANAHGSDDVMPAAFVNEQPTRDACLAAVKESLRG